MCQAEQWYACASIPAMHGNGYDATRCLPYLEFFEDGSPMDMSIDVLLFGYIITDGKAQAQYTVGYWLATDNNWHVSVTAGEVVTDEDFYPVAWAYLPDVPSVFEAVVKRFGEKSEVERLSDALKTFDLITSSYTSEP